MSILWIDLEAYSPINLKTAGAYRYAEEVEILLLAWALDDGPVHVVDMASGEHLPDELIRALRDEKTALVAHNAQFDRIMLLNARNSTASMRDAAQQLSRWQCTVAMALSHSLPPSLRALGEVLRLPESMLKLDSGSSLIHVFCVPDRSGKRTMPHDRPEQWVEFKRYAGGDIVAMRECYRKMPKWDWTPYDQKLWRLDQRINTRGFAVDVELAERAIELCKNANDDVSGATEVLTGGDVTAVTQRDKLLKHLLREYNIDLPDMRAATLERRIEDQDIPWAARELMALRLRGAKNSISKYRTVVKTVNTDGRIRGGLQFRGASRTGRDAGRLLQPQNLPRSQSKQGDIEAWIEAAKGGYTDLLGFDDIALASDAIRGVIIASKGKKLVQADFANVEGRLTAWLSGEEWKVQAFREFDEGTGPDLYHVAYARCFGGKPGDVTKAQRTHGKVLDLAGGYQGWVGACRAFADVYRVEVPSDEVAAGWMGRWREAHPKTVATWRKLEQTVLQAFRNPGKVFRVNPLLAMLRSGSWLRVRLPSGRQLCYPSFTIGEDGVMSYAGQDQYTRKWSRIETFGGKLLENVVQAVAADLLWKAVVVAESNGYPIVLRVHDELIAEVPDHDGYDHEGLASLMVDHAPAWASDLPLAAEGFTAYRYRKN